MATFAQDDFPPVSIGINEENLQRGSGLRTFQCNYRLVHDPSCITGVGDFSPAAGAAGRPMGKILVNSLVPGQWTKFPNDALNLQTGSPTQTRISTTSNFRLRPESTVMPVPMTPHIEIESSLFGGDANSLAGNRVKLRVRGYNQFGDGITEVTPWMVVEDTGQGVQATTIMHAWLSKVFASVTMIEYQFNEVNLGLTYTSIRVGASFRPDILRNAITVAHVVLSSAVPGDFGTYFNQGFGTPIKVRPFVTSGSPSHAGGRGEGRLDVLSGRLVNETTGVISRLPPLGGGDYDPDQLYSQPFTPTYNGGWTLGSSAGGGQWQGDPNKIGIVFGGESNIGQGDATSPLYYLPVTPTQIDLPIGGYLSPELAAQWVWSNESSLDVTFCTTVSKGAIDPEYPIINVGVFP